MFRLVVEFVYNFSISVEKSEVDASEVGSFSMRFHRAFPELGEPGSCAHLSEMCDTMPGYERVDLCRVRSAFRCWGQGRARESHHGGPSGSIWTSAGGPRAT